MLLEELRSLLVGVKWEDFRHGAVVRKKGVEFHGRYGLVLNQPTVAIIADERFVVIKPMTKFNAHQLQGARRHFKVIDPSVPKFGGEFIDGIVLWMGRHEPHGIYVLAEDEPLAQTDAVA